MKTLQANLQTKRSSLWRRTMIYCVAAIMLTAGVAIASAQPFQIIKAGQPAAQIQINTQGATGDNTQVLQSAGQWLADELQKATGIAPKIAEGTADVKATAATPVIILALADQYPKQAAAAKLDRANVDAFTIMPDNSTLYILGNTAYGVQHGVARLLHQLGFRYYNPMPQWHITPKLTDVTLSQTITDAPVLRGRNIWYAYGTGPDKSLGSLYKQWAIANRLPSAAPFHNGHSYGNIISRNKEAFDQHPEYFALLENGTRDSTRTPNARKFCVSNPGLVKLVIEDRIKLLEERQAQNPYEFMVSVDPSDGQGTCLCDQCAKIGTPTDRVIYLANQVAKALQKKHPGAWAGLYAYSSHRLPPTIDVEPNVYVQVAMGFNRTQYSLPELVSAWAAKVNALGLREYYGVEAWDWGLPGRMRGGQVEYHQKWIPYYAKRKLNAINAETNANWGGQTLGLYVAARLMWNPNENVKNITDEYFKLAFGNAEKTMRDFEAKMDVAPQLQPESLLPMYADLIKAYEQTKNDAAARARVVDLMAYMHYIVLYRNLNLAEINSPSRGDEFYDALGPLMEFAWRIRSRDMVHYYALARRLCNGLPLSDGRFSYWYALNEKKNIPAKRLAAAGVKASDLPDHPVWKTGEAYSDAQIVALAKADIANLKKDDSPLVFFTRYFDFGQAPGPDAGPCKVQGQTDQNGSDQQAVVRFNHSVTLYYAPGEITTYKLDVKAIGKAAKVTAYRRGDDVMLEQTVEPGDKYVTLEIPMPRPGEYRVQIDGDVMLRSAADVPLVYEASPAYPATLANAGPLYFYVPRGVSELMFDTDDHVTFQIPGQDKPVTFHKKDHAKGKTYLTVAVDAKAAGRMWQVTSASAGRFVLVNAPPLLSAYRAMVIVPREVSMADGLTTGGPAGE